MAKVKKFDPRAMMEKAIEVMRQSVHEHRADGRPDLSVGAVLVRPNGTFETAARGELRNGDHAEFTLLERKSVPHNVEDCILFTTLEPCLDRHPPKRGCARHIVSARIKEVYVGIEDDNPAVAGKGCEHLRRHGVNVLMFDRELQEIIRAENLKFFEWARQQIEEPKEEPIRLSKYEEAVRAVETKDLTGDALNLYRERANILPEVGSDDFQRMLRQQGILTESGDTIVPSGFGLLLFGNEPSLAIPQARLLARAQLPNGESSRKEFAQALVLVPGEVEAWLNTVLPTTIDRSHMERRERVDLPFEMLREAVINALIHRDYDLVGAKCHLVIDADTIKIKSPGGPISPITLEQMNSFTAPIKSRNPILHHVFSRMGMAEEQGFGLVSLRDRADELGLPRPHFAMEGDSLVLTIYRTPESATDSLPEDIRKQLNAAELRGYQWLSTQGTVSRTDYQKATKVGPRAGGLQLTKFIELGIVERSGSGKATKYRAIR